MRRIRTHAVSAVLGGLMLATAASASEGPAREQLETFSQGLERLHGRFTQTLYGSGGRVEERAEGELWLARPDRLRWEYGGDFPEIIVADGDNVWMHDVALEQVTVRPQAEYGTGSPFMLLTGLEGLDDQFIVRESGDMDGLALLTLEPRDPDADFEHVLLGLRDGGLQLMVLEDAFGLRTEIRFQDLRRNPEPDADRFAFQPPPGVDVVGSAADGERSNEFEIRGLDNLDRE